MERRLAPREPARPFGPGCRQRTLARRGQGERGGNGSMRCVRAIVNSGEAAWGLRRVGATDRKDQAAQSSATAATCRGRDGKAATARSSLAEPAAEWSLLGTVRRQPRPRKTPSPSEELSSVPAVKAPPVSAKAVLFAAKAHALSDCSHGLAAARNSARHRARSLGTASKLGEERCTCAAEAAAVAEEQGPCQVTVGAVVTRVALGAGDVREAAVSAGPDAGAGTGLGFGFKLGLGLGLGPTSTGPTGEAAAAPPASNRQVARFACSNAPMRMDASRACSSVAPRAWVAAANTVSAHPYPASASPPAPGPVPPALKLRE
eukprot:scaffold26288_cov111-Isochrysis_galbana.AAC.3